MQAFAFQSVRHESGIFRFECIKACLRHGLSRHVESARPTSFPGSFPYLARRNMKSKLAIKFPTPYEEGSNARPGEDLVHQIPSLPSSKRRQMPGVCPGGDV